MVSSSVLLMLKPMWTGTLQGGLYSFQTEWLRGFQQGDRQNVTQSELNRIIYSLRPILRVRLNRLWNARPIHVVSKHQSLSVPGSSFGIQLSRSSVSLSTPRRLTA
jgi:hypothetical protein